MKKYKIKPNEMEELLKSIKEGEIISVIKNKNYLTITVKL